MTCLLFTRPSGPAGPNHNLGHRVKLGHLSARLPVWCCVRRRRRRVLTAFFLGQSSSPENRRLARLVTGRGNRPTSTPSRAANYSARCSGCACLGARSMSCPTSSRGTEARSTGRPSRRSRTPPPPPRWRPARIPSRLPATVGSVASMPGRATSRRSRSATGCRRGGAVGASARRTAPARHRSSRRRGRAG